MAFEVGDMVNAKWSYKSEENIGFLLVFRSHVRDNQVEIYKNDRVFFTQLCIITFH